MRILRKWFGVNENAQLMKFNESNYPKYKEIYFCFGFENTQQNYNKFQKHLIEKTLDLAKLELKYNVERDNIEVYYCNDKYGNRFIVLLLDYYEPLLKDYIIAQIPVFDLPEIEMDQIKP